MGCELHQPPAQRYQCQQPDHRGELAIGTVIGEFNATDPDGDTNITFSLLYDPKLWLDASDVRFMRSERNGTGWYPQDGGVVGTWFDRTGNGHHAVAFEDTEFPSYYNMPDYIPDGFNGGLPTVAFRKDLMIVENSAVEFDGWNELTVFAVVEEVRYRTWATWFGKTGGLNSSTESSWHFMARRPDLSPPAYRFRISDTNGTDILETSSGSLHNAGILRLSFGGGKRQIAFNGTLLSETTENGIIRSTPDVPLSIGRDANSSWPAAFDLYLSEFIVFNDVFELNDSQWIEGYLADKWDLNDSLPEGHSYRDFANFSYPNFGLSLEDNGSLKTRGLFDYEIDENFSVTIRATDEYNMSVDKKFTFSISNISEDFDSDGIEDHNDTDIDGDGISNLNEVLYGSNPWDASSSNRPPSDINASNLTIAENSVIGSVIGEFNATDPDGNSSISISIVPKLPDGLDIQLWLDASDTSTLEISNGRVTKWHDKSGNDRNATQTNISRMPFYSSTERSVYFNGDFLQISNYKPSGDITVYGVLSNSRANLGSSTSGIVDVAYQYSGGLSLSTYMSDYETYRRVRGGTIYSGSRGDQVSYGEYFYFSSHHILKYSNNSFYLGKNSDGKYGQNKISELLFVAGLHTPDEKSRIESYLACKWQIDNNLSASSDFSLDENGTLSTLQDLDFEGESNYSLILRAKDEHNVSFDKIFTISVTNVVEDLDGDGTEDHNDTDIDGDGLTNAEELAYNSDPWDAGSSNRPPSNLFPLGAVSVAENESVGSIIVEFNASDPEGGELNYQLVRKGDRILSTGNLKTWLDASHPENFSTTSAIDGEIPNKNENVFIWYDQTGNGHHAKKLSNNPVWNATTFNGKPGVILQNASMYLDNSKLVFDEWSELTVLATLQQTNSDNFSSFFGKTNFSGWVNETSDIAWSLNSHRADLDLWGPALRTNKGAFYADTGKYRFAVDKIGPSLLSMSFCSGNLFLKLNGQRITQNFSAEGSLISKPNLDVTISGFSNGNGLNQIKISEFLIYEDSFSSEEIEDLEGYLAHKWNLQAKLPASHGRKSMAPNLGIDTSFDNHLFSMDANGSLLVSNVFDYETDDHNYTIMVRATDDHNVSFDKNFTYQ